MEKRKPSQQIIQAYKEALKTVNTCCTSIAVFLILCNVKQEVKNEISEEYCISESLGASSLKLS